MPGDSLVVECLPLKWKVGCLIHVPLSELPQRSLGKNIHHNRPSKKQISGSANCCHQNQ